MNEEWASARLVRIHRPRVGERGRRDGVWEKRRQGSKERTFPANAAHPCLLWLLAHDQLIDPASPKIGGSEHRAAVELGDRHGRW